MLGTSAWGNFINVGGIFFFTVGWIVCMWFKNAFPPPQYYILCLQFESSVCIFVRDPPYDSASSMLVLNWAFTRRSRCSCFRWEVPVHHEVVLLIITLDSKFLARRWKLRPAATPRNARWNPAVGVVMKSEAYFIFCFCGGSVVVVIMPHPALFLVSYSFLPIFPPKFRLCWRNIILRSPEFLLSWPCHCQARCYSKNFNTILNYWLLR